MAILNFLRSTILSKVVMAATGVILLLFICGHLLGNMQVFIGKETFNHYAQMLQSLGEFLWIIRGVLLLSLVLHIITSIRLSVLNNAAKPVKYRVTNYVKAKVNSRSMLLTGIMIAAFLTYHLLHFTLGVTNPDHYSHNEYYAENGFTVQGTSVTAEQLNDNPDAAHYIDREEIIVERHDVYKMVVLGFREPLIAVAYIIGVVLLGFHLSHAIQSFFQTLGITGPKFTPRMVQCSIIFSIIVVAMYISIPISILLGLVGGGV